MDMDRYRGLLLDFIIFHGLLMNAIHVAGDRPTRLGPPPPPQQVAGKMSAYFCRQLQIVLILRNEIKCIPVLGNNRCAICG